MSYSKTNSSSYSSGLWAKKPKSSTPEESVIGYMHHLSSTKHNRNNTMDYFMLQTAPNEATPALLYSPSKQPLLTQSQTSRTPIKLTNYTYTKEDSKIVVNDTTFIGKPQATEYSFQYSNLLEDHQQTVSILDVLNIHKAWDMVTAVGRITQLKQPTTVGSPRKCLRLGEATFTDSMGSIPLDLWGDHISILKPRQCYKMTSIQVRVWSNREKITTTKRTIITETSEESLNVIPL